MRECDQAQPSLEIRESSGRPVEVKVRTTQDPQAPFRSEWRLKGDQDWKCGDIELPEGHDHHLHFELDDVAKLGAAFKCTAQESFGAHRGADCPKAGANGDGEIDFTNSNVSGDGRKLFIRDRNHNPYELRYALFFDGPNGEMKYDPIIKNGGGGPPLSDPNL